MEKSNNEDLTVIKQVIALKYKSLDELSQLWSKMYNRPPAFRTRQYMMQKLAYRIQELAYGGLDVSTEQKLVAAAKAMDKQRQKGKRYAPSVGTKIVKEYKGRTYEVFAVEDGFAYGGAVYKSLSAVAAKITGTKWNGLKFFGIGDM